MTNTSITAQPVDISRLLADVTETDLIGAGIETTLYALKTSLATTVAVCLDGPDRKSATLFIVLYGQMLVKLLAQPELGLDPADARNMQLRVDMVHDSIVRAISCMQARETTRVRPEVGISTGESLGTGGEPVLTLGAPFETW